MKAFLLIVFLASSAWAAPTTRFIWLPNRPLDARTDGGATLYGAMRCGGYVPAEGITGATQIAWSIVQGSTSGGKCGVAIYDAPGTTRIATTGGIDCNGTGPLIATGIASFDLQAGTKYNICTCSNTAASSLRYLVWTDGFGPIARSFSGKIWRFAANNCDTTTGDPPTMTGSLTDTSFAPPIVLIGTGTP